MKELGVLIVDDSVVYRTQTRTAVESLGHKVLAVASNGRLALERLSTMTPDLLILDLEMPEMNGLQTLQELKNRSYQGKILVFSSFSKKGAEITMEALRLGASDFIPKPSSTDLIEGGAQVTPSDKIKSLLIPRIEALFTEKSVPFTPKTTKVINYKNQLKEIKPQIVVIGASTGGPTVLEKIFTELSFDYSCPVVIVQHMPPLFTKTFAERLGRLSGRPSDEVTNGMLIEENHIYVAPGDYHLELKKEGTKTLAILNQKPQIHSVRPAVDPLFQSAAEIYGTSCLAIVLTGMGQDGRDGAMAVKNKEGSVVIQDPESSVVYGMPGAVSEAGAFDKVATPDQIVSLLREKMGRFFNPMKVSGGDHV